LFANITSQLLPLCCRYVGWSQASREWRAGLTFLFRPDVIRWPTTFSFKKTRLISLLRFGSRLGGFSTTATPVKTVHGFGAQAQRQRSLCALPSPERNFPNRVFGTDLRMNPPCPLRPATVAIIFVFLLRINSRFCHKPCPVPSAFTYIFVLLLCINYHSTTKCCACR